MTIEWKYKIKQEKKREGEKFLINFFSLLDDELIHIYTHTHLSFIQVIGEGTHVNVYLLIIMIISFFFEEEWLHSNVYLFEMCSLCRLLNHYKKNIYTSVETSRSIWMVVMSDISLHDSIVIMIFIFFPSLKTWYSVEHLINGITNLFLSRAFSRNGRARWNSLS